MKTIWHSATVGCTSILLIVGQANVGMCHSPDSYETPIPDSGEPPLFESSSTHECTDSSVKAVAGICGCDTPDEDLNSNGYLDCQAKLDLKEQVGDLQGHLRELAKARRDKDVGRITVLAQHLSDELSQMDQFVSRWREKLKRDSSGHSIISVFKKARQAVRKSLQKGASSDLAKQASGRLKVFDTSLNQYQLFLGTGEYQASAAWHGVLRFADIDQITSGTPVPPNGTVPVLNVGDASGVRLNFVHSLFLDETRDEMYSPCE